MRVVACRTLHFCGSLATPDRSQGLLGWLDRNRSGLNPQVYAVSSINPTFNPVDVPIAVLVLDGVGRIQQVIDYRPSYLTSAPNLGAGMTESVLDPTRRYYFAQNYVVPRTFSLSSLHSS